MSYQPNTPPNISIRVLLLLLSISIPSLGLAQTKSAYTCGPNTSVPKNLIPISVALNICKEVDELNQHPSAESERINSAAIQRAFSELSAVETKSKSTFDELQSKSQEQNHKAIATLEVSAAIFGIGGAVVGGSLRLSKNSSTARAGTWVGIGAGAVGGGLALTKGLSDYYHAGNTAKAMIPEPLQRYILAKNPHFKFRTFLQNPSKLQPFMDQMADDSLTLQSQFNLK